MSDVITRNTEYKQTSIENYLRSQLGDPIVAALTEETDAIQNALNLALTSYWTAFPHSWMTQYSSKAQGTITDSVDNIMSMAFYGNPDAQANAYFLGVTRVEDGALGAIGNNIDSYLLGVPYPNPSYKVYPGSLDLAEIVRYRTEVSIITGEIETQYDEVARVVRFITPNAYGQFTVFYAFGFTEDTGLTYVPNRHIDMLRKITAYEFITSVINARGAVQVIADFKLDLTFLSKRRDELKEDVEKELYRNQISTVMWG
jgi:hypothetical protein